MEGLRCPSCGETRWHLFPVVLDESRECVVCGAKMVTERRRPGRARKLIPLERRTLPAPGTRPAPPAAPL